MADWTKVTSGSSTVHSGTNSGNVSVSVTVGDLIVVTGGFFVGTSPTLSVSDAVNTYTLDSSIRDAAGISGQVWSAVAATTATLSVSVASTSSTDIDCTVTVFRNAAGVAATPADQHAELKPAGNTNTSADSGSAAATTAATDLRFGFLYAASHSNETFTAGNDGQGNTYTGGQGTNNTTAGQSSGTEYNLTAALTATQYKATMSIDTGSAVTIHHVTYKVGAGGATFRPPIAAYARQSTHRMTPLGGARR